MPAHRKPPEMRVRRNKSNGVVILAPDKNPIKRAPRLPPTPPGGGEWHELVRTFWHNVWSSPVASGYLRSDIFGLEMLATLLQQFYIGEKITGALIGEIRSLLRAFGLTPDDRLAGLEWVVPRAAPAEQKQASPARPALPGGVQGEDPRLVLEDYE